MADGETSFSSASKKLVLCSHCDEYVSKRTYYRHKRLYFDTQSRKWCKERVFNASGQDDFVLEHEIATEPVADYSSEMELGMIVLCELFIFFVV